METLGMRLRAFLKDHGLRQKDLAKWIGITTASMSQFCNDLAKPSSRTIRDISAALGVNEEWLRDGTGPMLQETPRSVVEELAAAYNLSPAAARLLNALAGAFVELSEEQALNIAERLRMALAASGDDLSAPETVRRAINEKSPESSGQDQGKKSS